MDASGFQVVFYKELDGEPIALKWLNKLPTKARLKGVDRIKRLKELGYALRRPDADYLRDGIYELRWRFQSVNCRILYFFFGRKMIVLTHGLTKETAIPIKEIEFALGCKRTFERDPINHSYIGKIEEEK